MAAAYWEAGLAEQPATFSLFVRALPPGRGHLVAAGLGDVLDRLDDFHFDDEALAVVAALRDWPTGFLDHLAELRFTGSVRAVPEGRIVFPDEPILEIDGPLALAQLVETITLNQTTMQTVFATTASRYRYAAADRTVVDFALRRTHGIDAAMKLARAARIVGFDATSNVAASQRYGLPASGTMAHSFVQAYESEVDAFRAYARVFGNDAVLLVDTYDTHRGVERAIEVAREQRARGYTIRAIRLDSGDHAALARDARAMLDEAGFPEIAIFASGGLDEHDLARFVADDVPIDGFGVGTAFGVSRDAPALDSAYKLVELAGRPVRKTSTGKVTHPGRKQVWRDPTWGGDHLALAGEPAPAPGVEALLVDAMRDGVRTDASLTDLGDAHDRFAREWETLPSAVRRLDDPETVEVVVTPALRALEQQLAAHEG